MTLLTVVFAAVITTVIWYKNAPNDSMMTGTLCLIYWGASLMWLVDAVLELIELKEKFFTPEPAEMLNDLYLGLSAAALGLVIWLAMLLIKDPKKVVRQAVLKKLK